MLDRQLPKFRAADTNCQEDMVEEAADNIGRLWTEEIEFDRDSVINVRELSAKLGHSQIFLAYSPTSVR
jgi:hypothetical protein